MKNRSALGLVVLFIAGCGKGDNGPGGDTGDTSGSTSAATSSAAGTTSVPANTSAGVTSAGNTSAAPTGTTSAAPTSTGGSATSGGSAGTSAATTSGGSGASSTVATSGGGTTSAGETSAASSGETGDTWWFSGPRTPPAMGSWPPPAIKLTEVSAGTQPTSISAPRADKTRLYFTEKWGQIRVIKDGVLVEEPALDIRERVLEGGPQGSNNGDELVNQGKRGLVGLAFHPLYEENGRIFVMFVEDQGIPGYGTDNHNNLYDDGDMTFAEFRRSADNPDKFDPESYKQILQFDKGNCDQCSQHNGGALEIGVDGFLWASTGDPPPYDNPGSQDLNNLNGKLLRFDISGAEVTAAGNYPGADPFVASIGIRNTYKFSVDRYTGDLWVADVGENSWEEITVEKFGEDNQDHGWPKWEGKQTYMPGNDLDCEGCLAPLYDYPHTGMEGAPGADNCIVGGYVYRGEAIPELQGTYIYGDNGSLKIRGLQRKPDGTLVSDTPHLFEGLSVGMGCFGEDAAGEMYVCDYSNNKILRIDKQ